MTHRIKMAAGKTVPWLASATCLTLGLLSGNALAQDALTTHLPASQQIQENLAPLPATPTVASEPQAALKPESPPEAASRPVVQTVAPSPETSVLPQAEAVSGEAPSEQASAPALQPPSEEDLFQRIRQGFNMTDINNDLVLRHQQWYMNRPDQLRRMVERSSRYLFYIVEELEKRRMPMEIALLPMVESAFNPMAYSRAKASGLWQFIPATGKRYKLEQNWWRDERRDIVASTGAALDYLQTIYDMHGDWHLALASYNWGEGAVGRAVRKNEAKGQPGDYLSLKMPKETRNYVPRLQALKNIFSNPNVFAELNIERVPNRPYFSTVTQTANIDVSLAAQLAEMPVQEFVALNPSHNRPVIKSDSPLILPSEKMETFISNLEAHESSNKPLTTWQAYTLRPGEKLEQVAPRFGMTVANLKAANSIKGKIKLSPGITLLVPGQGANTVDIAKLPDQPRLPEIDQGGKRSRTTAVATNTKPTAGKTESDKSSAKKAKVALYTVRKGDTLASIANQFKVGKDDILRWNNISPNALKPGKTLTIQLAQNT